MFYAWSSRNLVKKAMPNWCQLGLLKEIRERRAWKAIACAFGAGYVREKIVKSVGRERKMEYTIGKISLYSAVAALYANA